MTNSLQTYTAPQEPKMATSHITMHSLAKLLEVRPPDLLRKLKKAALQDSGFDLEVWECEATTDTGRKVQSYSIPAHQAILLAADYSATLGNLVAEHLSGIEPSSQPTDPDAMSASAKQLSAEYSAVCKAFAEAQVEVATQKVRLEGYIHELSIWLWAEAERDRGNMEAWKLREKLTGLYAANFGSTAEEEEVSMKTYLEKELGEHGKEVVANTMASVFEGLSAGLGPQLTQQMVQALPAPRLDPPPHAPTPSLGQSSRESEPSAKPAAPAQPTTAPKSEPAPKPTQPTPAASTNPFPPPPPPQTRHNNERIAASHEAFDLDFCHVELQENNKAHAQYWFSYYAYQYELSQATLRKGLQPGVNHPCPMGYTQLADALPSTAQSFVYDSEAKKLLILCQQEGLGVLPEFQRLIDELYAPKVPAGYTEEDLEVSNPYNQWMQDFNITEPTRVTPCSPGSGEVIDI